MIVLNEFKRFKNVKKIGFCKDISLKAKINSPKKYISNKSVNGIEQVQ